MSASRKNLRHGYTTGACAAAAAKGAALLLRDQRLAEAVEIDLPAGFCATFKLHGQRFDAQRAACCVIKDAGDDPDVTNGCEVWAEVTLTPPPCGHPPLVKWGLGGVVIEGGAGIGRVTKPGLAVGVGEWAINPVPRRMIEAAVREVFATGSVQVCLSIPDGEERARRTLNARLGILGGLSILGTTGIVKPISTRAWTDTLDAALDVAVAGGCRRVVLSTGRTSELVAQRLLSPPPLTGGGWRAGEAPEVTPTPTLHPQGGGNSALGDREGLAEEAFVMMGDHVGYALRACAVRSLDEVILCGQFAKLLKIACGHEQTHVASSRLDLDQLAEWLETADFPADMVAACRCANTARQVLEEAQFSPALIDLVCRRARECAVRFAPAARIKVLLAGYAGEMLYFA